MAFLKQLHEHIRGPMTILWDGSNIHGRSGAVKSTWRSIPRSSPSVCPAYAPETNPDENVWQHTKHARLAKMQHDLVQTFLKRCGRVAMFVCDLIVRPAARNEVILEIAASRSISLAVLARLVHPQERNPDSPVVKPFDGFPK